MSTYLKFVRTDIRFRIGDTLKTIIRLVVKNCFGLQTFQHTLRNLQLYVLLGTNPNNRKSIKQELGQPHFKLRLLHITWFYIYKRCGLWRCALSEKKKTECGKIDYINRREKRDCNRKTNLDDFLEFRETIFPSYVIILWRWFFITKCRISW